MVPALPAGGEFTGRNQSNYIERSFIFTEAGLTTLNKTGARRRRFMAAKFMSGRHQPRGRESAPDQP